MSWAPEWLWQYCAMLGALVLLLIGVCVLWCVAGYVWVDQLQPRIDRRRAIARVIQESRFYPATEQPAR